MMKVQKINRELGFRYLIRLGKKSLLFFIGCYFTYALNRYFDIPIVLASAVVGLLGTFLPLDKKMQSVIYCGSFAGMCSSGILNSTYQILLLSLTGAFVFIALGRYFNGLGGKLGTVAFISVVLVYLIRTSI